MRRFEEKRPVQFWGLGIVVALAVMAGATSSSCVFDTKTNFCEEYGLRCKEGQECAANQPICIDIGTCGDHIVSAEKGEVCDDGNVIDGDGCSADCKSTEVCGNGIKDPGEFCDDGNKTPGDGCNSDCTLEACGNKVLDPGERCDDGNRVSGDGCREDCMSNEACGNGVLDAMRGEQCEFPNSPFPNIPPNTALCDSDCTFPMCGDGHPNPMYMVMNAGPPHTEQCDDGVGGMPMDSLGCDSDCTMPMCGDGHQNPVIGEECDDGANNSNVLPDACRLNCHRAFCGDGVMDAGEMCDDHNNDNDDLCVSSSQGSCRVATCGDGLVRTKTDASHPLPEGCDDGNGNNGDACPDGVGGSCRPATCGDGFTRTGVEECDDGNTMTEKCMYGLTSCMVCNSTCHSIMGATSYCGDGVIDTTNQEVCDDFNNLDCGTCSADCKTTTNREQANGNILAIRASDIVDGETFALDDGFHPAVVFELRKAGTAAIGHVLITLNSSDNANEVRAKIVDAINGVADLDINASGSSGNVVLVNVRFDDQGNVPITETVSNTGFMAIGMSGGVGTSCATNKGCRFDQDCLSLKCASNVCQ